MWFTECGAGFWDKGEKIPSRYKPLAKIYDMRPMTLSSAKHFGDKVDRERFFCLGAKHTEFEIAQHFTKDKLVEVLGRKTQPELIVEDMFAAPAADLKVMLQEMAEKEKLPPKHDMTFREALNGTLQGRLKNCEISLSERVQAGLVLPFGASVCHDLDHNVDACNRTSIHKVMCQVCHGNIWIEKLQRTAHHLETLELNCISVWQCEDTFPAPFAKLYTEADPQWQCSPTQWKRLGGNSQHLPTFGSFIGFGLANLVPKSEGFPLLPIFVDDSEMDNSQSQQLPLDLPLVPSSSTTLLPVRVSSTTSTRAFSSATLFAATRNASFKGKRNEICHFSPIPLPPPQTI